MVEVALSSSEAGCFSLAALFVEAPAGGSIVANVVAFDVVVLVRANFVGLGLLSDFKSAGGRALSFLDFLFFLDGFATLVESLAKDRILS